MKIIISAVSLIIEFVKKVMNWDAITAVSTAIMALCAILALFDWKKEQKIIIYRDRRDALKQLNDIILKFDDVYNRLFPSFEEIPALLHEIEGLRVHLEYDNELKNSLKKYYDTYFNIHSFTTVLDKNGKESDISQEKKDCIYENIYPVIQKLILAIPTLRANLIEVIQKKLEE